MCRWLKKKKSFFRERLEEGRVNRTRLPFFLTYSTFKTRSCLNSSQSVFFKMLTWNPPGAWSLLLSKTALWISGSEIVRNEKAQFMTFVMLSTTLDWACLPPPVSCGRRKLYSHFATGRSSFWVVILPPSSGFQRGSCGSSCQQCWRETICYWPSKSHWFLDLRRSTWSFLQTSVVFLPLQSVRVILILHAWTSIRHFRQQRVQSSCSLSVGFLFLFLSNPAFKLTFYLVLCLRLWTHDFLWQLLYMAFFFSIECHSLCDIAQ